MAKKIKKIEDRACKKGKICLSKAKEAISKMSLTSSQSTVFDCIFGFDGAIRKLLLSDIKARWRAIQLFLPMLAALWKEKPETRNFYHLTFFDDMVTTSDRVPIIELRAFTAKASAAIRQMCLDAFVVIEIHAVVNHPQQGEGRTLLIHAHALAFTDIPFDYKAEQDYLNVSGDWQCSLGADPVRIQPLPTKTDVLTVGGYILKHPHSGKNLRQDKPAQILQETVEGYRPELHLRVLEFLSHIPFSRGVCGVGKGGAKLKSELLKALGEWHAIRLKRKDIKKLSPNYSLPAFWAALRQTNGSRNFKPFHFEGEPEPKPKRGPRLRPQRSMTPEQRARVARAKKMRANARLNAANDPGVETEAAE